MATFRQLKSGRWQARVSQDGHEFSIGTFRTKKEAMLEAARVEEKIYYGHTLADKNKKFNEVAEEWLNVQKRLELKESTFVQYESAVRNHILPHFGDKKIMRIKRIDIQRWMNEYAEMVKKDGSEAYSYGSRLRYLSILKSIFHYATNDLEILDKDPSLKLRVAKKDKAREEDKIKYYSLDELNKLLDYMKNHKPMRFKEYNFYYVLFYLLSRTGLRISEALALTWDDVIEDILVINKQTSRDDNNRVKITSPKNLSSNRRLKMDSDLVQALKRFKVCQNEMRLKDPRFKKNKDNIIFQNGLGEYLTPSVIREMLQKYCAAAGVDYKGLHVFRHTHAVILLESGANLKYVSQRLGHQTIKTTADTYLDITEKIEEDELNKFAAYTQKKSESAQNRHDSNFA